MVFKDMVREEVGVATEIARCSDRQYF